MSLGFYSKDFPIVINYGIIFILNFLYTILADNLRNSDRSELTTPLIIISELEEPTEFKPPSRQKSFLSFDLKETSLHIFARLLVIMWTIYFKNYLSIIIMIPVFISIISMRKRIIEKLYRWVLIPLLFIGYFVSYIQNIINS